MKIDWLWIGCLSLVGYVVGRLLKRTLVRAASADRDELERLLASGVRVHGTLIAVEGAALVREVNFMRVHRVPIEVELQTTAGAHRVRSALLVPETQLSWVQAGAPCEVVMDPNEPTKLCVVEVQNAFGVRTAVTWGSMYVRW